MLVAVITSVAGVSQVNCTLYKLVFFIYSYSTKGVQFLVGEGEVQSTHFLHILHYFINLYNVLLLGVFIEKLPIT